MEKNTSALELITVRQAAALANRQQETIRRAVKNHKLDRYGESNRIMLDKKQVLEWAENKPCVKRSDTQMWNMILDFDESLRLVEGLHNPNNAVKPARYMVSTKYAVSNKGNVYELSKGTKLKPTLNGCEYLQVSLCADSKRLDERVHILTAFCWCPNAKFKKEVHHINAVKTDNNKDNLIWVTTEEHVKAHKLLNAAKNSGDFSEYDTFIATIQSENQWKGEYRGVVFERECKGLKYNFYLWIDKLTYEGYLNGTRTLDAIPCDEVVRGQVVSFFTAEDVERVLREEEKNESN